MANDEFDDGWLRLREPFDHQARNNGLAETLNDWACDRGALRITDLGSGTGSNYRFLSGRLKVGQKWTLIEHDKKLIKAGQQRLDSQHQISYRQGDLNHNLEDLIGRDCDLITASALIDLVSAAFLKRLIAHAINIKAALFMTLTYDGRLVWRPGDPFDRTIHSCFDRHQQTDKGFGPALGPKASEMFKDTLQSEAGRFFQQSSDWEFRPEDIEIQQNLLVGYQTCAKEVSPEQSDAIDDWFGLRSRYLDENRSRHVVGHQDQLWLP